MPDSRASQKPTTGLILAIVVVFCIMMFMVSRTYPAGPAGTITTTVVPVPKPPPPPHPHGSPMIPLPIEPWNRGYHPEPHHPHNPCNRMFPENHGARAQCQAALATCHAGVVSAKGKHPYESMQDFQDCIGEVVKIDPKAVAAGLHRMHPHAKCIPPHLAMHKKKAFEEVSNTINALPKVVDWAQEIAVGMPTCGSSLAPHFASGPPHAAAH
jgi:hypothetical protein